MQLNGVRQKRIGPGAMRRLLQHLPTSASKLCMDLTGTGLTDRSAAAIAYSLPSSLLELSLCFASCNLQTDGCVALGLVLSQGLAHLSLDFRSCPISQEGVRSLLACIAKLHLKKLRLEFGECGFGLRDAAIGHVAESLPPSLVSLCLSFGGCPITELAAVALLTSCGRLPQLKLLQLLTFGCPIADFKVPIPFSRTVKRVLLNLSGSCVGDRMMRSLGHRLPDILEELELTLIGTAVTDSGLLAFAEGLPGLTSLALDVSGCRLGDDAIAALLERLPAALQSFSLGVAGCEIQNAVTCGLTDWPSHILALTLDISDTSVGDSELLQILKGTSHIKKLSVSCQGSKVTCTNAGLAKVMVSCKRVEDSILRLDLTRCSLSKDGLRGVVAEISRPQGRRVTHIIHDEISFAAEDQLSESPAFWRTQHNNL